MKIRIEHAIRALHPDAQFTMINDDITEWNSSGITQPTEIEINNKILQLEAEEPARLVREKRDQLLNESDWTQTRDNIRLNDSAWKTYRQALRDITATITDDAVRQAMADDRFHSSWPTKPS